MPSKAIATKSITLKHCPPYINYLPDSRLPIPDSLLPTPYSLISYASSKD
ncbi:hypothetical protein [Moorena producens]|nr:hypothetical protein [Moorena producens]